MMELEPVKKRLLGWSKRLGPYKYVLLVIAAGAVLLLWPEHTDGQATVRQFRRRKPFL